MWFVIYLQNYAEDALKEVLGWYGLQEGAAPPGLSPGYNSPHINGKNRPPPQPTQGPPQSAQTQLTPTSQPTAYSTAPTSSMTWPTQPNRLQPNMSSMDVTESPQNAETDLKMGIMTDYGSSNSLARSTTPSNFCCKSDNPLDLTNGHATVADMGNSSQLYFIDIEKNVLNIFLGLKFYQNYLYLQHVYLISTGSNVSKTKYFKSANWQVSNIEIPLI